MRLDVVREEEDRLEEAVRFPPVLFFFAVAIGIRSFQGRFSASGADLRWENVYWKATVLIMPATRLPRPTAQQ